MSQWCIYWTETDSFSGKVSQHWIDAETMDEASRILERKTAEGYKCRVGRIADLDWHPKH